MKRWLVILVILLALPTGVFAQTATPTDVPTLTPTGTPIPTTNQALIPIGAVIQFAGSEPNPPLDWLNGWLLCDGSPVSRTDYAELFLVIGETYGVGDGSTTFNLPDFRGRVPVGTGMGSGLTLRVLGDEFGEETHVLTISEMPSHDHSPFSGARVMRNIGGGSNFTSGSTWSSGFLAVQGGGQAHNIMQPALVVNFLIWTGTETIALGGGSMGTPAPEIMVYSTVEVGGLGQNVAFRYEIGAGEFMISILLLVIAGVLILQTALKVWGKR